MHYVMNVINVLLLNHDTRKSNYNVICYIILSDYISHVFMDHNVYIKYLD